MALFCGEPVSDPNVWREKEKGKGNGFCSARAALDLPESIKVIYRPFSEAMRVFWEQEAEGRKGTALPGARELPQPRRSRALAAQCPGVRASKGPSLTCLDEPAAAAGKAWPGPARRLLRGVLPQQVFAEGRGQPGQGMSAGVPGRPEWGVRHGGSCVLHLHTVPSARGKASGAPCGAHASPCPAMCGPPLPAPPTASGAAVCRGPARERGTTSASPGQTARPTPAFFALHFRNGPGKTAEAANPRRVLVGGQGRGRLQGCRAGAGQRPVGARHRDPKVPAAASAASPEGTGLRTRCFAEVSVRTIPAPQGLSLPGQSCWACDEERTGARF